MYAVVEKVPKRPFSFLFPLPSGRFVLIAYHDSGRILGEPARLVKGAAAEQGGGGAGDPLGAHPSLFVRRRPRPRLEGRDECGGRMVFAVDVANLSISFRKVRSHVRKRVRGVTGRFFSLTPILFGRELAAA
jgi:hypothetical protein